MSGWTSGRRPTRRRAALALAAALVAPPAMAQDSWNPFNRDEGYRPPPRQAPPAQPPAATPAGERAPLAPMDGLSRWLSGRPASETRPDVPPTPADGVAASSPIGRGDLPPAPIDSRGRAVESGELAPAPAPDGSGLPYEMWQGLDLQRIEALMAELDIPPKSPALGALWRRLLASEVSAPAGAGGGRFAALRAEALYRSGLVRDMADVLAKSGEQTPLTALMQVRIDLGRGRVSEACATQRRIAAQKADLPKPLRIEALLVGGLCAAVAGNASAAGLAAELAREEGAPASFALSALDAIAVGQKPSQAGLPQRLTILDYRLLELGAAPGQLGPAVERAEPALLAALAESETTPPPLRIAAAEAAARLTAITGVELAEAWRRLPAAKLEAEAALATASDPIIRRAALFRAAESERTPQRKARQIRALLDDARRVGLYVPTAVALERTTAELTITPEIGWFAETAIEVMLLSGRYQDVRRIAGLQGLDRSNEQLSTWLALADIADPAFVGRRGESLQSVEQLALRGRFGADVLHRLATVLDALDYNVPIPLWEAASRTPQPTGGHLPDTGILTELKDAAQQKQFGRTVMLTMRTIGPGGPDQANIIALGDAIRALKRAGFEADARRLGLEALFAVWPRTTSN